MLRTLGERHITLPALLFALPLCLACSSESDGPVDPSSSSSAGGAGGASGGGGTVSDGGGGAGATGGAGGTGGSPPEQPCEDPGGKPLLTSPPATLSETGLYDDIINKVVAADALPYSPAYQLWSDGADKSRWIDLPNCTIGSADMDHWVLPVGTRVWKEFRLNGVAIETRFMHRFGSGESDWLYAAYQWDSTLSEADLVTDGVVDANGTSHDIPAQNDCPSCHSGLVERLLGFSAVQLSHGGAGETMATLSSAGRLSLAAPSGFPVPGDSVTQAALGYLHANCSSCHNPALTASTIFSARLSTADTTPEATDIYTQIGRTPAMPLGQMVTHRIAPGQPTASAVWYRMSVRQPGVQMPPLASEVVDGAGLAAIEAWIAQLPP